MPGVGGRAQALAEQHALTLLALLGAALAAPAVITPGTGAGAAAVAAVSLAVCVAYGTRSRAAWTAAGALAAYNVATALTPHVNAEYETLLTVEGVAAFLPFTAVLALSFVLPRVPGVRSRTPRFLLVMAVVTAFAGTLARVAAATILSQTTGGHATIPYALRLDAAASLWAAAGLALAGAAVARVMGARRGAKRPMEHVRDHASPMMATMLVLLVIAEGGAIAGTLTGPQASLEVGYHADRVENVPEGAGLVHLEAAWSHVERERGTFDWSSLDREFAEAEARGLDVYFLANTYPPQWFTSERPESVMVDRHGRPFHWIDETPGKARERIWDVSFADPVAVAEKERFLREAVERYGEHPSVRYVAVQNEPAYPVDWNPFRWASFDPFTVEAFRDELHDSVNGNLTILNAVYDTEFADWEDVTPPDHPFGAFGEAWMRFREDLLITFVTDQMEAAREHTDKPVTAKMMAHFFTRFAEPQAGQGDRVYRAIAGASDVVSVDLYPVTKADLVRSLRYFHAIADGKPVVVAEFNLALGLHVPGAGFRLLGALHAMDPYADAVILFTAENHFVYGRVTESPGASAANLHGTRLGDEGYARAVKALVDAEARNLAAAPGHAVDAAHLALLALRP